MDRNERQERLRRKLLARFRLKALCRKVIENAYWLSAIEDTTIGSNPRRNVNIIIRRSRRKGIIKLIEKSMFNTPNKYRSDKVREKLKQIITTLCFQTIPPKIREGLADLCHFRYCNPKQLILREKHSSSALYYILDSEVIVSKQAFSMDVGGLSDHVLYTLVPGDIFGVDGLIYGNKRAVTCTAAVHTELLYINKEDISDQLRTSLAMQWEQIKLALKRFDYYFGHFTEQQILECCIFSKIREYLLDEVVYDRDDGERSTVFFLLSGKCMVLQHLNMKLEIFNNQKRFNLLDLNPKDDNELKDKPDESTLKIVSDSSKWMKNLPANPNEKKIAAFINVATLHAGSIFGLVEEMVDRSIVTKNVVQCLEIPRFWLLQRLQNSGNIWQRTKIFYTTTIPSREMMFRDFVRSNKRNDDKDKYIKEVFLKSKL